MIPKIYIGTEPRMWLGLEVLKHSIKRHSSTEVEFAEMNYALGGNWFGWDMGREPGIPATRTKNPKTGGDVWFTDFSCFRYFIPEANNFEGSAIYLDFDQIVIGDINELFNMKMDRPVLSCGSYETSVLLYDCSKFKKLDWWLYGDKMKQSGWNPPFYNGLLRDHKFFGDLTSKWNCLDGRFFAEDTKLIHYTDMSTQPHRPYPERIQYRRHNNRMIENLWFDEFYDMIDNNLLDMNLLSKELGFLEFEKVIATERGRTSIS